MEATRNKEFLTVNEIARIFQVKPLTVYKWIWDGKLPAYKVGGLIRVKRQDLSEVMEKIEPKKRN